MTQPMGMGKNIWKKRGKLHVSGRHAQAHKMGTFVSSQDYAGTFSPCPVTTAIRVRQKWERGASDLQPPCAAGSCPSSVLGPLWECRITIRCDSNIMCQFLERPPGGAKPVVKEAHALIFGCLQFFCHQTLDEKKT